MLFHARKFEQYLAVLFKLLDVGGNDAKLVDTGAEHVGRAAHTVFYLLLERVLGCVKALAAFHLVLEHNREVALRVELAVFVAEYVDIVGTLVDAGYRVGVGDGGVEVGVAFRVGHRAEDVGNGNLKCHVHTALEVETEAYGEFLYFVESVAEINFFVSDVLDVLAIGFTFSFRRVVVLGCLGGCIFLGLALPVVGHHGERKVEEADEHHEDGYHTGNNTSQRSFALHCVKVVY